MPYYWIIKCHIDIQENRFVYCNWQDEIHIYISYLCFFFSSSFQYHIYVCVIITFLSIGMYGFSKTFWTVVTVLITCLFQYQVSFKQLNCAHSVADAVSSFTYIYYTHSAVLSLFMNLSIVFLSSWNLCSCWHFFFSAPIFISLYCHEA